MEGGVSSLGQGSVPAPSGGVQGSWGFVQKWSDFRSDFLKKLMLKTTKISKVRQTEVYLYFFAWHS